MLWSESKRRLCADLLATPPQPQADMEAPPSLPSTGPASGGPPSSPFWLPPRVPPLPPALSSGGSKSGSKTSTPQVSGGLGTQQQSSGGLGPLLSGPRHSLEQALLDDDWRVRPEGELGPLAVSLGWLAMCPSPSAPPVRRSPASPPLPRAAQTLRSCADPTARPGCWAAAGLARSTRRCTTASSRWRSRWSTGSCRRPTLSGRWPCCAPATPSTCERPARPGCRAGRGGGTPAGCLHRLQSAASRQLQRASRSS